MQSVPINELMFLDAFERDVDYHDTCPQTAYLDLETGEVVWVFEEDEDAEMYAGIEPEQNEAVRVGIEASPEKYIEIPGRDHSEHHEILREFLASDWTEDKELRIRAREAYTGSIGRWIDTIGDRAVVHAYYDFRESRIKEMMKEFLHEHGISPLWR